MKKTIAAFAAALTAFSASAQGLSWNFTSTSGPSDTLGWTTAGRNYIADSASPFFSPFAIGDGGGEDDEETGHVEYGLQTYNPEYYFLQTGANGLNTNYGMVGYKTQSGALSAYNGGTLNFRLNEQFDGNWFDSSRIPSNDNAYVYIDGYVGGKYTILRFKYEYQFDAEQDSILSLALTAGQFENLDWTYVWPDMQNPQNTCIVASALTDAEFEELLSGEVGIYFRMAANEAVYVGAGDPEPVTYLKEVYLMIPEPADFAVLFGALAIGFVFISRRKK